MMRKWWLSAVLLFVLVGAMPALAQEQTYVVQRGDTLRAIAQRFNVPLDAILVRNDIIDPNRIRSGQRLIIPTGAITPPTTHTVQPGERLIDIAIRYNTTVEGLIAANNLSNASIIRVGQVLRLPATGGPVNYARTYIVDRGDTLRTIAERFGLTWQTLATYNNIAEPNRIAAGTVINIPPAGTSLAWPPAPATGGPVVVQPQPLPQPVPGTYIVRPGDTMVIIARAFGVDVFNLARANRIYNLNQIFVGQVLTIPR